MVAEYTRVCALSEIAEGETRLVMVNDIPVALARHNSEIYALEGVCNHDGGEFDDGCPLVDGQIECPRHGARFDIKSGEPTRMPAVVGIETYDVKIENGDIFVAIED